MERRGGAGMESAPWRRDAIRDMCFSKNHEFPRQASNATRFVACHSAVNSAADMGLLK